MKKNIKMGLIRGRHQMPVEEYVLDRVDDPADIPAIRQAVADRLTAVFEPYMGIGTANMPNALEYVDVPVRKCVGARLDLYVTGLTSAALETVSYCHRNGIEVSAWHYNMLTGEYVEHPLTI